MDYLFTLHWPRVLKIKWSVAEGGGVPKSRRDRDQFLVPQELVFFFFVPHSLTPFEGRGPRQAGGVPQTRFLTSGAQVRDGPRAP